MVASPHNATLRSSSNVVSTSRDTFGSTPPPPPALPPSADTTGAESLARRSLSLVATRRNRCTSACASDCPMRTFEAAGSRGLVAAPPPRPRAPPLRPPPPLPAAKASNRPPEVGDTVKRGGGGGGGGGDTAAESDVRIILGRLNTLRTGGGGVDATVAEASPAPAPAPAAAAAAGPPEAEGESRFPAVAAEAPLPLRPMGCRCCCRSWSDIVRGAYFETDGVLPFFFFFVPVANWVDREKVGGMRRDAGGHISDTKTPLL